MSCVKFFQRHRGWNVGQELVQTDQDHQSHQLPNDLDTYIWRYWPYCKKYLKSTPQKNPQIVTQNFFQRISCWPPTSVIECQKFVRHKCMWCNVCKKCRVWIFWNLILNINQFATKRAQSNRFATKRAQSNILVHFVCLWWQKSKYQSIISINQTTKVINNKDNQIFLVFTL